MKKKNGVKLIQTAGYNGARTVVISGEVRLVRVRLGFLILVQCRFVDSSLVQFILA